MYPAVAMKRKTRTSVDASRCLRIHYFLRLTQMGNLSSIEVVLKTLEAGIFVP